MHCDGRGKGHEQKNGSEGPRRLVDKETIAMAALPPALSSFLQRQDFDEAESQSRMPAQAVDTDLEELERTTIQRVFEQVHGDKALPRKILGIIRAPLYPNLKHSNIPSAKVATAPSYTL